jgi:chloramphenicol 3-O phosphotransferase
MVDGGTTGRVLVLNGTSSAGKTTLATALQEQFASDDQCWIIIGVDDIMSKLPFDWVTYSKHIGRHAHEGMAFVMVDGHVEHTIGPIGQQALAAYRASVAGAARAGLNVIVDEVLLSEDDWNGWQDSLAGIDARWVEVSCPLEVIEKRERARDDRMAGIARAQYDIVHLYPAYDAKVDTNAATADALAAAIRDTIDW